MKVYTYSKARQHFATLLKEASKEGRVQIRRRDGTLYEVAPVELDKSSLDVPGLSTGITASELVSIVRASRRRARGAGLSGAIRKPVRASRRLRKGGKRRTAASRR